MNHASTQGEGRPRNIIPIPVGWRQSYLRAEAGTPNHKRLKDRAVTTGFHLQAGQVRRSGECHGFAYCQTRSIGVAEADQGLSIAGSRLDAHHEQRAADLLGQLRVGEFQIQRETFELGGGETHQLKGLPRVVQVAL